MPDVTKHRQRPPPDKATGADGDVIDITLTTVKVHNWAKTIPTYALTKNWQGMQESGGSAAGNTGSSKT